MIQNLEATAQALYRKMFVDDIDKENLPDGWRVGKLGDYTIVKSGYAFPSNWWRNTGIPVIKIGDIINNTIDVKGCDCVDENKFEYAKKNVTIKGDIVIAMTGATLGKIAIVPKNRLLVNQRVGLFDLGEIPIERAPFLYWLLQQDEIQKEIVTVGGDSAQANVSNTDIERIEISLATKDSIEWFNSNAGILLKQIMIKNEENEKLTELQSLLLAKMGQ